MVNARAKGRRGESAFGKLLESRDYDVIDTTCGKEGPDFVALDAHGVSWAFEVKNRRIWTWGDFRKQARAQSGRSRWALACKVPDSGWWYVEMQGREPELWR